MITSLTRPEARKRIRILLVLSAAASSTSTSPAAAAAGTLKTTTLGGATVLTDSKGFTLYSFAPDTSTTSKCYGTCAANWPPVTGPVTAPGVTGTFGTAPVSSSSAGAGGYGY